MKNMTFPIVPCVALFIGLGMILLAEELGNGTVAVDRAIVRARPLGTAEICCQLKRDDPVQILERIEVPGTSSNLEGWLRIVLPEKATVWIKSDLLKTEDEQARVLKRVNGRAGPGLNWPSLCILSSNEQVTVRTNATDWVGIVPPKSASGWIAERLIRKDGSPSSSETKTENP
jgi:hypothetical protein